MVQTDFEYSEREYIKLNRKILKWEWYSDPNTRALFIHCLLKAKWRPGKWHGYAYRRGQFITSLSTLSVRAVCPEHPHSSQPAKINRGANRLA